MTYRGHVENGAIVLDEGVPLPEGAVVNVELAPETGSEERQEPEPTLYDIMRPVIGAAKGLPGDLARNHDHYLHGRPKK